jgi:hypothetical protein
MSAGEGQKFRQHSPSHSNVGSSCAWSIGGIGSIAGYSHGGGGSPQAQNAAILHELAHNIKNAAGNGFLIPNDGKDTKEGLSPKNTELIRKKCTKEIFNGK